MPASFGHQIPRTGGGRVLKVHSSPFCLLTRIRNFPDSSWSREIPEQALFHSQSLQSYICKSFSAGAIYDSNISSFINKHPSKAKPLLCNKLEFNKQILGIFLRSKRHKCTIKNLYLCNQSFAISFLLSTFKF